MTEALQALPSRGLRRPGAPVRLWALSGAIGAALAGLAGLGFPRLDQPPGGSLPLVLLAVGFFAAEAWVVHVHLNREGHTLSLTGIPLTVGLLTAAPWPLLAALLAGSATAVTLVRRQPPLKAVFNVSQLALSGATAIVVFGVLAPAGFGPHVWAAAVAAACAHALVGVALVSVAVRIAEGATPRGKHLRVVLLALLGAVGTTTLTIAGYRLVQTDLLASLLVVVPAALLVAAFRGYTKTRSRHEHLEFLYDSMRKVQGADGFRGAAEQLLQQLAQMLRADFVELLFLGGRSRDGELQVVTRHHDELVDEIRAIGGEERLVLVHAALSKRSVLLARGHKPHPVDRYLADHGLRDAMIVPLRGEERELGAIVVGNRVNGAPSFSAEDSRLFETFAAHAAVLLENDHLERSLETLTKMEAKLRHQAYHDALTGLANREAFIEATNEALAGNQGSLVILFVDLDDFKTTNDSLGHAAGDALLRVAGQRVSSCLRAGDLAARLGGDEFAVLLHGARLDDAQEISRRIEVRLAEPVQLEGHECSLRGSIGIALAEGHVTAETLLREADLAMYAAKEASNRSHAVSHREMQQRVRTRHSLAAALAHSLDRDEIVVAYQPVVALETGRVSGFEALVRWDRGADGVLGPGQFLDVAEETGMIAHLGRFVLADACRRAAHWQRLDPGLSVSVNLSAAELRDATLRHEIKTILGATGLEPSHLTIEVTEATAMIDAEATHMLLTRLREIGVRIALDDFGTGYSSLSYLESMPLDLLKVPKELVAGLRGDRPRTVILGAIHALAHSLGLGLIAEGVEQEEQATRLRELGYAEAQGFLLARPLAAADVEPYVRKHALARDLTGAAA
jgi:diguanylate cyclase (GGDEF)-like protein